MHLLLATVVLAGSPVEPVVELCPTHQVMAQQLADEVQTGTLLFSQGDCLAVKVFSRSEYTHVATVVVEDKQPMVYESTNGVGVRRISCGLKILLKFRPGRYAMASRRQTVTTKRTS